MSQVRLFATVLLVVSLTFALQGCLVTRIVETRSQLCDDQPSQVVVVKRPGGGLSVVFAQPTLTDRDVVAIVGYEPMEATVADAIRVFVYEALALDRPQDHATGLVARLSFVLRKGEYRLSEVEIPEKFDSIFTPALVDAGVRVVCKTQLGVVPPSATFDLSSLDRATLPSRKALTELLGMPTRTIDRTNEIAYQYCLAPCVQNASMVADLLFSFDSNGELRRLAATYFRYSALVDFTSSPPRATVQLH